MGDADRIRVSLKLYFSEWQKPFPEQPAHPHPQEDFPFFLFFTILTIIAATTAIKTAQMITVAIFSKSQASIFLPPLHNFLFCYLNSFCQFFRFGIALNEQHIHHPCENGNCCNQTDHIQISGKDRTELIDHQGDCISKHTLIADGEPGPLCRVHFTLDGADCRKAGGAEQIEHQDGLRGKAGHSLKIKDTEHADNFFLCHKAHDGCNGSLDVAEAEW